MSLQVQDSAVVPIVHIQIAQPCQDRTGFPLCPEPVHDLLYVDYNHTVTLLGYADFNSTELEYSWSIYRHCEDYCNPIDGTLDDHLVEYSSRVANSSLRDLSLRAGTLYEDTTYQMRLSVTPVGTNNTGTQPLTQQLLIHLVGVQGSPVCF